MMGLFGTAMRAMTYDAAGNKKAAVPALKYNDTQLSWFRADDGVMGGQSVSNHDVDEEGILDFKGTLNTDGGGFTSIRAPIEPGTIKADTKGIKITYRGDGKTFRFTLADREKAGGPFSTAPIWKFDFATEKIEGEEWQEVVIEFDAFEPTFGGKNDKTKTAGFALNPTELQEIGFMLSMWKDEGFDGEYPFELKIKSIEPVS
jgi:NADH dehydrogenase [ubiquinone] 1 alpha subcomplex assembly factor 1